jgi:hypothetical protein
VVTTIVNTVLLSRQATFAFRPISCTNLVDQLWTKLSNIAHLVPTLARNLI